MPVTTLFSSAATLLYAVSTLLSGAQNVAVQGPLMRQSDPISEASSNFIPFNGTANPNIHINTNTKLLSPAERVDDLRVRARGLVTLLTYRPSLAQAENNNRKNSPLSDTDNRQHEQQMAEVIFRQLITHSFRNNASAPKPDEITYYDKETIATLYLDVDGNVTRCRLIEVIEPEESDRILQMIAEKHKLIEKTTFRTMLSIITACQVLEPKGFHQLNNLHPEKSSNNEKMPDNWMENYNMWSLTSGILPGTKWCGLGDISSSYDDLGAERNLDKCCRAHDHCPIKIKAFRSRYGLVNWSLYTKSHCECDRLLYDCLKKSSTPTAEMLGNFYFNVLRIQCVDDEEPTVCASRDPSTGNCKLFQPDTRQPKRMLFRSVRREF